MPQLATRFRLTAVALGAGTAASAWHQHWIAAAVLTYLAFTAVVIAAGSEHHDRTVWDRHEQARRAAASDDETLAAVPSPCCSFWRHSEGKVHGPDCTRPPLPRRDTARLTSGEQAAFEEITAREEGSAA